MFACQEVSFQVLLKAFLGGRRLISQRENGFTITHFLKELLYKMGGTGVYSKVLAGTVNSFVSIPQRNRTK